MLKIGSLKCYVYKDKKGNYKRLSSKSIKDTLTNKKNVTWFDVFADTKICHMNDKRPFMHYFKIGLGLKI